MEKVVIIGTGPAGLTAALYTARADLAPLVVEGLQPGGQLTTTTEVENYPGFPKGIEGCMLVERMKEQAVRFGARFVNDEVVSTDFAGKPLCMTLSNGEVVESASFILSTGATAMYLDLDSVRKLMGRGVSACATCDGAFYRDVPVAVVGGGDTAVEEALFLSRLASKVTVIHRRDKLRASSVMADRLTVNSKIEMIWDSVVEEVLDVEKDEVTGLRIRNVKTGKISKMEITGLFMGIGHRPNTEIFSGQLDLDEKGYIVVTNTRASVDGVFAAGDVQDRVYKQAVTAAGSGCMAALEVERYLESVDL